MQTVLSRLQLTPLLDGSLLTVAVNRWVPPDSTDAPFGVIATAMLDVVTEADPVLLVSVTDVAVMLTLNTPTGGFDGAV